MTDEPPRPGEDSEPSIVQLAAAAEELRALGWNISDIVEIYGPAIANQLTKSLESSGDELQHSKDSGPPPDDASTPLKTAQKDRTTPLTPVGDVDDLERAARALVNQSNNQDIGLRKSLAKWTMWAASLMLGASTAMFGVYIWSEWRQVPSQAIIAWLSSTVLQVLGIVYVIANYLFPKPPSGKEDSGA